MRYSHRRLLLIVVRRQEIILLGAEKVKIAPYILRAGEQILPVVAAQLRIFPGRQSECECGKGSQYPQQSDGLGEYAGRKNEKYGARYGGKPHISVIAYSSGLFSLALRGGLPFKEVFTTYELPPQSRCRRRYAYPGLVRQKPQPEQRLDEGGSYTFYKPAVVSELEVGRPVCTELREGYEKADSQSQHSRPCG